MERMRSFKGLIDGAKGSKQVLFILSCIALFSMIGRMANGHQCWFVMMCAALLSGIVSSADTLDLRRSPRSCQPARGAFLPLYDKQCV
jgi:hypothetical protein